MSSESLPPPFERAKHSQHIVSVSAPPHGRSVQRQSSMLDPRRASHGEFSCPSVGGENCGATEQINNTNNNVPDVKEEIKSLKTNQSNTLRHICCLIHHWIYCPTLHLHLHHFNHLARCHSGRLHTPLHTAQTHTWADFMHTRCIFLSIIHLSVSLCTLKLSAPSPSSSHTYCTAHTHTHTPPAGPLISNT